MPTKIEWATETWNPISGCTPVSEGCQNCYAKRMAQRLRGRFGYPPYPYDPFSPTIHYDKIDQPLKWKKPRRVFVCSMGDLFHQGVEYHWQIATFSAMIRAAETGRQHTFLLLTKRPAEMQRFIKSRDYERLRHNKPTDHIWLGVTAENQKRADERIPVLLQIPAAKRFVSIEPMLGPVDLGLYYGERFYLPTPDWVIVGGETGPGARPMNPDWARSVRDQCQEAGVPFFFKKMSKKEPIPKDLMIREYPE